MDVHEKNRNAGADPDTAPLASGATGGDASLPDLHTHDQKFTALYAELHRIARREARRHGEKAELGATTLLHEAYLQMAHRDGLDFPDHGRFLAYVARAMRGLVIDRVRARGALRRGGGLAITSLDTQTADEVQDPETLSTISDALDELALLEPELAQVVDLRFFCGFTMAEIAGQRGVSERTVQRQWEKARGLLYRTLKLD
jgi:RNA polymerase sigma factor (TIGR02999 family)